MASEKPCRVSCGGELGLPGCQHKERQIRSLVSARVWLTCDPRPLNRQTLLCGVTCPSPHEWDWPSLGSQVAEAGLKACWKILTACLAASEIPDQPYPWSRAKVWAQVLCCELASGCQVRLLAQASHSCVLGPAKPPRFRTDQTNRSFFQWREAMCTKAVHLDHE